MSSLAVILCQNVHALQSQLDAVQQAASLNQMILAAWRLGLT